MEHAQDSASLNRSTTAAVRRLNPTTVLGVASMIGKVRQLVRGDAITPLSQMAPDEQEELHKAAIALINTQHPETHARALLLSQECAEGILAEAGFVSCGDGALLARKIASTAVLTHRLALEGTLDLRGGVQ